MNPYFPSQCIPNLMQITQLPTYQIQIVHFYNPVFEGSSCPTFTNTWNQIEKEHR